MATVTGGLSGIFKDPEGLLEALRIGRRFVRFEGIDIPLEIIFGPLPEGADYYEVGDLNGDGGLDVYTVSTNEDGTQTIFDVRTIGSEGVSITQYGDWAAENIDTDDEGTGDNDELRTQANQAASELNSAIGGVGDEQQISDYIFSITSGPMPEPTGTGPSVEVDVFQCLSEGGNWKECTTLGIVLKIPGIPQLPSAILGTIFRGKTIAEIEEMIKNASTEIQKVIGDIGGIFTGENQDIDIKEILGKVLKDAEEKIEEVLGGDGNGDITTGDIGVILEDAGEIILQGAWGVVVQQGEQEIKNVLGLPIDVLIDDRLSSDSCFAQGLETIDGSDNWDCSEIPIGYGLCDDNLTEKLNQDGTNCPPGQSIPQVGEDCFTANDEAGTITNVGGELKCVANKVQKMCQDPDVSPDANGRCPEEYCADGTTLRATQPLGICPEDRGTTTNTEYTEPTVDCENPKVDFDANTFDPTAPAKYASYSAKYDAECAGGGNGDGDGGTSVDTTYVAPTVDCENPKVGFSPSFDPTAPAKYAEYSQEYDATCLGGGGTTSVTPTFTVVCGEKEPYAPTGNALAYNTAYREYEAEYNAQCLSGGDTVTTTGEDDLDCSIIDASNFKKCGYISCTPDNSGPFVPSSEGFKACPGGDVIDDGDDFDTGTTCNDPNAINNGQEGDCRCKPGFVKGEDGLCFQSGNVCDNGATVESGCDTCPDGTSVLEHPDNKCPAQDCSNPAYAAANPEECITTPECNDCTCAEYAVANPEECGTGGGGGAGGGGGGGGGFGGGMFSMTPTPITAAPELLAAAQFPIVNFLSKQLPPDVKSNVLRGLFTGDGNIV